MDKRKKIKYIVKASITTLFAIGAIIFMFKEFGFSFEGICLYSLILLTALLYIVYLGDLTEKRRRRRGIDDIDQMV